MMRRKNYSFPAVAEAQRNSRFRNAGRHALKYLSAPARFAARNRDFDFHSGKCMTKARLTRVVVILWHGAGCT